MNDENSHILKLYIYVTEDALINILREKKLNISRPWSTNDITEAVKQREEKQQEKIKEYGYICLSETCTSPAMWGYYADRSRGACLAFTFYVNTNDGKTFYVLDRKGQQFQDAIEIKKVEYCKNRASSDNIDKLIFRKSKDWSHEKEYRIKVDLATVDFIETKDKLNRISYIFKTDLIMEYLRGIILGVNCKKEKSEIDGIIRSIKGGIIHDPIQVIRAKMDMAHFEFNVPTDEIPYESFVNNNYYDDENDDLSDQNGINFWNTPTDQ